MADELDGTVAAPDHHRILFENDRVRVVESRIPPGERTPVHRHLLPELLIVRSGTHLVRRDAAGAVVFDTRIPGSFRLEGIIWTDGTPELHTMENVGEDEVLVDVIELKA